jgi:DNA-directed RNA polymerase subunit RPC12/RpoP
MEKEEITSIEKIKCPYCKRKIVIDARVKIPQNIFKLKVINGWFDVRETVYTGPDSVIFKNPDPPVPEQYHWFKCVDASDRDKDKTPKYDGKFRDDGSGESEVLVEEGIRDLTETKVINREWIWVAKKRPTGP